MKKSSLFSITSVIIYLVTLSIGHIAYAGNQSKNDLVRVSLETNYGTLIFELNRTKAPITVANFLRYVESGRYQDMIFHRAEKSFVIQTGGYKKSYEPIEVFSAIKNEADNGLKNIRGSISMARHSDKDSADSQFFINLSNNSHLDYKGKYDYGYAVFGKVTSGMNVADDIGNAYVGRYPDIGEYVPMPPVVVNSINVFR